MPVGACRPYGASFTPSTPVMPVRSPMGPVKRPGPARGHAAMETRA